MPVPYDQGRPIWVDDDRFDITYHVRLTALPKPGTRGAARRADRPRRRSSCSTASARCGSCGSSRASRTGTSRSSRRRTTRSSTACRASTSRRCCSTSSPTPSCPSRRSGRPQPRAQPAAAARRHARRARHRAGRDRAVGPRLARGPAARADETHPSSTAVDAHDRRRLAARAAHVAQRPIGRHRRFTVVRVPLDDVKRSGASRAAPSTTSCSPVVAAALRRLARAR